MTRTQIAELEQRGNSETRIEIRSPQSGTITKMMLREGQYIKPGDVVYEVADLSRVWLLTELFPEDAASVRYGQRVAAHISSLPGELLDGRVSFVDPMVDANKRAVQVRIELDNPEGKLAPGDEATVEIRVPAQPTANIYDEQLAGKWICPVHPDVVESNSGTCVRSQRPLVPTSEFGFVDSADSVEQPLVIRRDAVLMAGDRSAVYVETEPGQFEIRLVTVGARLRDEVVILEGLTESEVVATNGNFLIDSQMQLAGKPSLIDPSRATIEVEKTWDLDLPPMGPATAADTKTDSEPETATDWDLPPTSPPVQVESPADDSEPADDATNPKSRGGPSVMTRALVNFCLRERVIVLIASVAIVAYGWRATREVPLDAIPNVGENQVIVLTEWMGRSPKDVEDQITYPLSIALQGVPGATNVRGKSMFGFSFVQVTFADSVDFYWARSRVAEQLTTVGSTLPPEVTPTLAPDATALGQIFYYVLEPSGELDLADLRSKQDFVVKYALQSVEGVAEVASIGGYERQYQVEVDPDRLRYHELPLDTVIGSVRAANMEVGAKTVEAEGMEYIVRGKGFLGSGKSTAETIEQIEQAVVTSREGVPVRIRDVATVQLGPAFRRGALDFNGSEAVGGIVVMRHGENPRAVIQRVKAKIAAIEPELDGIRIRGIYDRTELIDETVATLTDALLEEVSITIAVMVLFLLHIRASLVIAITLPMAVLMSFIAMKLFHVDANIMSLAGIAIAIGTMVDMGIIILENIYSALAEWEADGRQGGEEERLTILREAAAEVVPAVMTAVTTTIVSFLPVFFLTGRDHRLFVPLAWTKTFALASSLIVAVTVVPMLCRLFLRTTRMPAWASLLSGISLAALMGALAHFVWGDRIVETLHAWTGIETPAQHLLWVSLAVGLVGFGIGFGITQESIRPMENNPVSRFVRWLYAARLRMALDHKALFLTPALLIFILGLGAWLGLPAVLQPLERFSRRLGTELNDLPGYVDAKHTFTGLKTDDWIALDEGSWFYMPSLYPAASFTQAMSVLQTQDALMLQIPEVANVLGKIGRAESALDPAPAAMVETYVMLKPRSEWREGVTSRHIWDEINRVATLPGVTPASPLQPIEGRVVMLQSGIKASMAVRIYGDSLEGLSTAAVRVADRLRDMPFVNAGTVNPDIVMGKPYYEFDVDRETAARYGMSTTMINQIIAAGLGGVDVTTTVEGRERYPVQVRYSRDVREGIDNLPTVPVVTHSGEVVPLSRVATVSTTWGPGAINSEDARLVAHVAFAPTGALGDLETVEAVMSSLRNARASGALEFPDGNFELQPVGSFQNQIEANQRLMWLIPLVLLINFLLHYLHFRNFPIALVVFTGIPVSFAGGMIAVAVMGVDMNTAIWIGFIALFGLAADDGIVIASYIQQTLQRRDIRDVGELRAAIYDAGLKRIRPCVMTTVTTLAALAPVLMATGRGADVARAMALPVFGGMLIEPFTSFIVPTLYCAFMEFKLQAGLKDQLFLKTIDSPVKAAPIGAG